MRCAPHVRVSISLAKRLGALVLGADTVWNGRRFAFGYRRDTMLDRGVTAWTNGLELVAQKLGEEIAFALYVAGTRLPR